MAPRKSSKKSSKRGSKRSSKLANPWIQHLMAHKGEGLTRAQLLASYKKSGGRVSKGCVAKGGSRSCTGGKVCDTTTQRCRPRKSAAGRPSKKGSRKASKKASRRGSRKASKKASRKASRKGSRGHGKCVSRGGSKSCPGNKVCDAKTGRCRARKSAAGRPSKH